MRLIVRFGVFAALLGLLAGAALRLVLGRRRFPLLAVLAELPLAAHAGYLVVLAVRAGVGEALLLVFVGGALATGLAAALLGRAWTAARPWWTVATPLVAAICYYLFATLVLTPAWESRAYSPDAVAGAVYGMGALFATGVLLPFALPGAGGTGQRARPG